jgi:hypothetical protein
MLNITHHSNIFVIKYICVFTDTHHITQLTYVTWSFTLHLAKNSTPNKTHIYMKGIYENLQQYCYFKINNFNYVRIGSDNTLEY